MSVRLEVEAGPGKYEQLQPLPGKSALDAVLKQRGLGRDEAVDSRCRVISKRVLQSLLFGFAACDMAGGAAPNMASVSNRDFGKVLAVGNICTFIGFYALFPVRMIENALKTLSPEEQEICKSEMPRTLLALKVASAVLALIGQMPFAYANYIANDAVARFFLSACTFGNSGMQMQSLYSPMKSYFESRGISDAEKRIEEARDVLVRLLNDVKESLPSFSKEASELFDKLPEIEDGEQFLEAVLALPVKEVKESDAARTAKKGMTGLGHVSNIVLMVLLGALAYSAMGVITDNEFAKIGMALLAVACNFQLTRSSIGESAPQPVKDLERLAGQPNRPSISQALLPRADGALTALSYFFPVFSWGWSKYFCEQSFPSPLAEISTVFTSAGSALLAVFIVSIIRKEALEFGLSKMGSEGDKKLLELDRKIGAVIETIGDSNRRELTRFIKSMTPELRRRFASITDAEMDQVLGVREERQALIAGQSTGYGTVLGSVVEEDL